MSAGSLLTAFFSSTRTVPIILMLASVNLVMSEGTWPLSKVRTEEDAVAHRLFIHEWWLTT